MARDRTYIAHRGARYAAPENTDAAFATALRYNLDGIEFDVQLSRDDHLVIFHDHHLSKITDSRKRIADFTLAELKAMDWGSWFAPTFGGERIMEFGDVLRRYADKTRLFIEIKSHPEDRQSGRAVLIAKKVLAEINALGAEVARKNLYILSFDPEVLWYFYTQKSNLPLILNLDKPVMPQLDFLSAVGLSMARLRVDFIRQNHSAGRKIMAWSCNDLARLRKALTMGVDIILTDDPRWLSEFI